MLLLHLIALKSDDGCAPCAIAYNEYPVPLPLVDQARYCVSKGLGEGRAARLGWGVLGHVGEQHGFGMHEAHGVALAKCPNAMRAPTYRRCREHPIDKVL